MLNALVEQADAKYVKNKGRTKEGEIMAFFVYEAAEDGSKVPDSLMIKANCISCGADSDLVPLRASLCDGGVGKKFNGTEMTEALFDKTNADGRKYLVWKNVFHIEQRPVEDYNGDDVLDTERLERICTAEMEKARLARANYQVVNAWKLE